MLYTREEGATLMNVGDICTRNPITVSTGATLAEVARLMRDHHVGAVIVTKTPLDQPVAVGIVTDRDVACAQLDHLSDLNSLSAEQAMTRNPVVVNEEESLSAAIGRMRDRGVRRAPVLSMHGALVGLVSTDDLLPMVARELLQLARIVSLQPRHEAARKVAVG
jgi:CBS domain-containing protein